MKPRYDLPAPWSARVTAPRCACVFQQRFDELEQVVDLLSLAAVLVHLAVAGQDVQGLEQFNRLAGADVVVFQA